MTITRRNRPLDITDAPEHRSIPMDRVELRDDSEELTLVGYASTYEPYEMYGGPEAYGWIEEIDRRAFDKTLREKPDLHLLINHAGMPLARTKSGTLQLSADDHGLRVEAKLDRSDPDVQRLEAKMRRGDMDEMSFAFRVKAQEWSPAPGFEHLDDDQTYRRITEVSLHKGDVSVVNFGANPTTHAEVKSVPDALKVLAECDPRELAEVRADDDLLARARAALEAMMRSQGDTDGPFTDEQLEQLADVLADLTEEALAQADEEEDERADVAEEIDERADGDADEDDEDDEGDDDEDMPADECRRGMSLTEALALQGVIEEGVALSLAAALALLESE